MKRRSFFSALIGASTPLVAAAAKPVEPMEIEVHIHRCAACQGYPIEHRTEKGERFLACTNPECRNYNVAFRPPRVALERFDQREADHQLEVERLAWEKSQQEKAHDFERMFRSSGHKIGDVLKIRKPFRFADIEHTVRIQS